MSEHEQPGARPERLPDPDELITIAEAARLCGLAPNTLRTYAKQGRLRTELVTARLAMTTRRWLQQCLDSRGAGPDPRGRPPRPLPESYVPPPRPGPGRPPRPKRRPHDARPAQAPEGEK